MAGLGWRKFQAGEVLTAANLQSYAVDQSVQVYAGTAARGSAIGTATTEGMVSYLADQNKLQVATSSSVWVDVYPTAPISGSVVQVVQASTATQVTVSTVVGTFSGLTGTITPKYSTSKILIIVAQSLQPVSLTNSYVVGHALARGTWIYTGYLSSNADVGAGGALALKSINSIVYLDSPATTSATTYTTNIWVDSGLRIVAQEGSTLSTITLIEVAA
jgi:hypothetical protein